jgi:hypothetical protein
MSHRLNLLALLALIASLAAPVQAQPAPPAKNGSGPLPPSTAAVESTAPVISPNTDGSAVKIVPPPAVPANGKDAKNGKTATETPAAPIAPPTPAPEATTSKPVTPPSPTLSDLGRSLRTYFTEEELDLLFQYMKESVIASFKGEEVNLPPDLSFKLEILLVRMQKEGSHYMDNLMQQMEKDLKHKLKEKLVPPPVKEVPYNPWYPAPQR